MHTHDLKTVGHHTQQNFKIPVPDRALSTRLHVIVIMDENKMTKVQQVAMLASLLC